MAQEQGEALGEAAGRGDEARGATTASSAVRAQATETGTTMDRRRHHHEEEGTSTNEPSVTMRLIDDPTLATRIKAPELERLFEEIQKTLQRCSVPMRELVQTYIVGGRLVEELVASPSEIAAILQVDQILKNNRTADNGALAMYFRRSICNLQNLEAMLSTVDPDTRADQVRSVTFALIEHSSCDYCSIWNEKLSNDLRFATNYLFQLAKSLERRADNDDGLICMVDIASSMEPCLRMSKDTPIAILNQIYTLDWNAILESKRVNYRLYVLIASEFLFTLSDTDRREPAAVAVSKSLEESCFGVLQHALRQILELVRSNETSSPQDIHGAINWMRDMRDFVVLVGLFMPGPPPQDIKRELDVLFGCVHKILIHAQPHVVNHLRTCTSGEYSLPWLTVENYDELVARMRPSSWAFMNGLTMQQRSRWRGSCSSREAKTYHKQSRRLGIKTFARNITTAGVGDICVNCFKTDRDLPTCSLCNQVAYCGQSCQTEHWKRIHRSKCPGRQSRKNSNE